MSSKIFGTKTLVLCLAVVSAPMLLAQNTDSVPVTTQTVTVLNHIIFMVQENRGLDHYFGALRRGKAVEDADLLNS